MCALALMVRTSSDYYSNELVFTEFSSNSLNKDDTDTFVDKNVMTSSPTPPVSIKTKTKKNSHSKKPKDENDQV